MASRYRGAEQESKPNLTPFSSAYNKISLYCSTLNWLNLPMPLPLGLYLSRTNAFNPLSLSSVCISSIIDFILLNDLIFL